MVERSSIEPEDICTAPVTGLIPGSGGTHDLWKLLLVVAVGCERLKVLEGVIPTIPTHLLHARNTCANMS